MTARNETISQMVDRLLAAEQLRLDRLLEEVEPTYPPRVVPAPTIHLSKDKRQAELILLGIRLQLGL